MFTPDVSALEEEGGAVRVEEEEGEGERVLGVLQTTVRCGPRSSL